MERRFELDILRAVALFLLFVFHTNLNSAFPNQMWTIGTYMLGAFFFISGILFQSSIKRHSAKDFLKNKLLHIYIPFLAMLVLYFIIFTGSAQAYIYHATGLSIFHIFQTGALNLFHMWYVVHLLAYFLLFFCVYKLVKSEARRHVTVIFILLFLVLLWIMNSPLRLEWKFASYLPIFYAGTLAGNNLDRIYDKIKKQTVGLLALTLLSGFFVLTIPETAATTTYSGIVLFIVMRSAFAITACMLSLRVFLHMRIIRKAAAFVSLGSVFTYLLQPAVSQLVSCTVTGNCFALGAWSALTMTETLVMIPVSFLITVLLAHGIRTGYNVLLKKIRCNAEVWHRVENHSAQADDEAALAERSAIRRGRFTCRLSFSMHSSDLLHRASDAVESHTLFPMSFLRVARCRCTSRRYQSERPRACAASQIRAILFHRDIRA